MNDKILISILLQGESFSPNEAEKATGLCLSEKYEVGDIGKIGKYKNKPLPYGSAILEVPDDVPADEKFNWLMKSLEGSLDKLYNSGADETRIYAGYFYKDQCNITFTKQELKAIASLNIDLWLSCYDISDGYE